MYQILPYTIKKAKALNVVVKPSNKKNKKIDVFDKKGNFIVSIGDNRYLDYPYYLKFAGKKIADQKKSNFYLRHINNNGLAGYYAKKLLW